MREFWDNQFQNLFLWVPFVLAFGAALYFTWPTEPPIVPVGIFGVIATTIVLWRRVPVMVRAVALFVLGFCYAAVFTHITATPGVGRSLRDAQISGTVARVDYAADKTRLYMNIPASQINPKYDAATDATVRVTIDGPVPHIGDSVTATVNLYRPAGAYAPETFDYARWAYFNKLTATGFASDYTITSSTNVPTGIDVLRDQIHTAAASFLVDGLVLGYKSAVPDDARTVWTAAGIAHVWSISGFHMTLVSGWLFALFYVIFRSIAPLTRRIPARIPAMICAWMGLAVYLFLSGAGVATIRAFLMITLAFGAFILGRDTIRLRTVCMAFLLIFLINPGYVMTAGFQLSFAAIFGLVWYFGDVPYRHRSLWGRVWRIVRGAVMTSIVATVFTAPFVIAHFYSMPTYALVGNLVLLPVFSLAIMPLVMMGAVTASWGWMGPLDAAHWVYDRAYAVAEWIAELPHATLIMPHIPNVALGAIIIGLGAIMFIRPLGRRENYLVGGAFIGLGIIIWGCVARPLFLASPDNELVAFAYDGKLEFNKVRAANHFFAFDTWRQLNCEDPAAPRVRRKCPGGVCIYKTENWNLAYVQKFVPLMTNINQLCNDDDIDYIVSYFRIDAPKCANKILHGGAVIYPSGRVTYAPRARRWHNPRR